MNNTLYSWLQDHFRRDNHPKYRRLFDEWVKNVTPSQAVGFEHDMKLEKIFIKGL